MCSLYTALIRPQTIPQLFGNPISLKISEALGAIQIRAKRLTPDLANQI